MFQGKIRLQHFNNINFLWGREGGGEEGTKCLAIFSYNIIFGTCLLMFIFSKNVFEGREKFCFYQNIVQRRERISELFKIHKSLNTLQKFKCFRSKLSWVVRRVRGLLMGKLLLKLPGHI